jgi:hypothetical protein
MFKPAKAQLVLKNNGVYVFMMFYCVDSQCDVSGNKYADFA